jgi:hypothetical protein
MKRLLLLLGLLSQIIFVQAIVYTDSCATINDGYLDGDREVRLNDSVDDSIFSCFDIGTSNVILDCQGNSINATNWAIYFNSIYDNVTIKNCELYAQLRFVGAGVSNSNFTNLTFIDTSFQASNGGTFTNTNINFLTFYNGSFDYESGLSNYNPNNSISNLFFYGDIYFPISRTYNTIFSDFYFDNGDVGFYFISIGRDAQNNTFTNMVFNGSNPIIEFVDHTISSADNIFYNNIFYTYPNITSTNWSLTPNQFNLSGQGNTYYGLSNSGTLCFDDPLNQTCDYFAQPLLLSSPDIASSLFPFGGILNIIILLGGLILYFR